MRNSYDFSPLFRSAIGIDHLSRLLEASSHDAATGNYPPYNIEKLGDDAYCVTMAVAGFAPDELDIVQKQNELFIRGAVKQTVEDKTYLYRGIAGRAFERRFHLADHVRVVDAKLENGMLFIELEREVPEALKPRRISIQSQPAPTTAAAA
jgi:molecular chaperone IbpA